MNNSVSPTFFRRCLVDGGGGIWPDESESGRTFFWGAGFGPFQTTVLLITCLLVVKSDFGVFSVKVSLAGKGRGGYECSLWSCKISKSLWNSPLGSMGKLPKNSLVNQNGLSFLLCECPISDISVCGCGDCSITGWGLCCPDSPSLTSCRSSAKEP